MTPAPPGGYNDPNAAVRRTGTTWSGAARRRHVR